jgi:hypothetical protein
MRPNSISREFQACTRGNRVVKSIEVTRAERPRPTLTDLAGGYCDCNVVRIALEALSTSLAASSRVSE